jgi:hypothetical protein
VPMPSPAFDTIDLTGLLSSSFPSHSAFECQQENLSLPPVLELVDDAWTQLCASMPSNPTPSPSCQLFFDELMSQDRSDIGSSQFLSFSPTPASLLAQNQEIALEKAVKLEKLRRYQDEVRKLEAELLQ